MMLLLPKTIPSNRMISLVDQLVMALDLIGKTLRLQREIEITVSLDAPLAVACAVLFHGYSEVKESRNIFLWNIIIMVDKRKTTK